MADRLSRVNALTQGSILNDRMFSPKARLPASHHRLLGAMRLSLAPCLRVLFAVGLTLASACVQPRAPAKPAPTSDIVYLRERRIMVPVDGFIVTKVPDSFRAKRGGRIHNAIDFMAPKGTPVLAADDGEIFRLTSNEAGGITIYATDARSRMIYYYAHLDRYRRGLDEGDRVRKGDVIGYVGHSGNANRNAPHLHFQIMRLDDIRRWWAGTPIDPKPVLRLNGSKR